MDHFFEELRTLLAKDELESVLEKLQYYLKNSKALDEVILHSASYNDVMKQIRMNTIDFKDADVKKNKIRYALIDIVGVLEDEAENNPTLQQEIERVQADFANSIRVDNSKNVNI